MYFKDYVENLKKQQRTTNLMELRKEIESGKLTKNTKTKIQNFVNEWEEEWGFTFETVLKEILNNDIIAAKFAINPTKQNISEKTVADFLQITKLTGINNDIRFDSKGKKYINAGAQTGLSKNADFNLNGVYITQKYTGKNTGGAQDNQYDDVVKFLTYGSINHKVGALVDGWYWEENGKREKLENYFKGNPNVYIFSADDYKEYGDDIFV